MFSNGFPKEWSTLRKLAWLYRTVINAVSAVLKTVIGNPIHILDALAKPVQALSIALEPIQDLHGYDNPWPAGGGVNKCPSFANGTHTMTNGLTVTIQDGEITINGTASGSGYYQEAIESTVMPADAYVSFNNPVGTFNIAYVFINGNTQIASPSIAPENATKQPTGLSGATVNTLRIYCNAATYDNFKMSPIVHDGSTPQAWQPYSNICPISGWTGAKVTRTGKNVLPNLAASGTSKGITYTVNADKSISLSGTANGNVFITLFENMLIKAGTYTLKGTNDSEVGITIRKETATGSTYVQAYMSDTTATFDTDVPIACVVRISSGKNANGITIYPQLEVGSTATAYEPYQGETYSITFPTSAGTVYGGTLDVTQGKLTVDRAMVTLTSDMAWQYSAGTQRFFVAVSGAASGSGDTPFHGSCNVFKAGTGTEDNAVSYVNTSFYGFAIKYPAANGDMTAWKQFLSDNTVSVVYPLATPTTIQLTPTQVELLQGENNIWSDGEMTLVYLADGNASDVEALNILLGGRYVNNHTEGEPTDREALDIVLGGKK